LGFTGCSEQGLSSQRLRFQFGTKIDQRFNHFFCVGVIFEGKFQLITVSSRDSVLYQ
jgi:hypothetical protein